MRCTLKPLIAASILLFGVTAGGSQQDPLRILDGIWVSVNPPGPHVTFSRVGGGTREASLPMGQASIRVSDGKDGSNIKVSGAGFNCYYFHGTINQREFTWELKSGEPICMPSAHYKKDPP